MKITDRYGTVLRCYDNGVRSFDRYTILPPRWAGEHLARYRVGEAARCGRRLDRVKIRFTRRASVSISRQ